MTKYESLVSFGRITNTPKWSRESTKENLQESKNGVAKEGVSYHPNQVEQIYFAEQNFVTSRFFEVEILILLINFSFISSRD